jgi:hypothetical protein
MPLTYHIDTANKILICDASGSLTAGDVRKFRKELRNDPEFAPKLSILFDMLDVTDFQISSSELEALAGETPMSKTSKRAYVTPTDSDFGMLRIFATYSDAEPDRFQVFRDIGEARKWLGLD